MDQTTNIQPAEDQWRIYSMRRIDLMENKEELRLFLEKISGLAESIKETFFSPQSMEVLIKSSEDFDLSDEQIGNLTRICRDTLLGDLFINDMASTIAQKLNIDEATAQQIQERIVKELFAPAIEDIKKIQREKFPDRVGQGVVGEMPQPPAPIQMKNAPPVNQSNVIDLRNQS